MCLRRRERPWRVPGWRARARWATTGAPVREASVEKGEAGGGHRARGHGGARTGREREKTEGASWGVGRVQCGGLSEKMTDLEFGDLLVGQVGGHGYCGGR